MIAAVCLVVLVCLITGESKGLVILPSPHFSAPPNDALRTDPTAWEIPDGVLVSLLIRNDGDEDDRLLGGSSPVAESVAPRRSLLVHGRPAAVSVPGGIAVPAEATLNLEPGKYHLALFGLRTALVQGETFPLTLRFERAGTVTVMVRVRRRVDAAGIDPIPEASAGDLTIALVSAPPAPGP